MQSAIPFNRESLIQLFSKKFLIVVLISIPSAIVADFLNIPLAWMIGPMIAIIGPIIHARGIFKKSATMALGIEIKTTIKNFLENSWIKLSRLKGIALCMYSIFGC